MRNLVSISALAVLTAAGAHALTLADCTRTTHISHGGQADHADLGDGRVMWRDWWSQEGTATSFSVLDCGPGDALMFRTAEDNMSINRTTFDRTDDALAIVDRHQSGARVFATFGRMAVDLSKIARDVTITTVTQEPCACAAAYPALRGDKTEFMPAG